MIDPIWFPSLVTLSLLACIETVLYIRRSQKFSVAQNFLLRAKQEVQEISQLPLHSPHPQIQVCENGKIIFANPAALRIFSDLQSKGFDHPALHGIQNTDSREILIDKKTYHQTIVQTRVSGEKAYVVYCYDITDRKTYESEIQAAHKRAEKMREAAENAKEARGEFLANMSHELRTPMNGIIGLSDILMETEIEEENRNMVEAVNSSARNLLILLNDILDFSKIEAGELMMEKIPFDVRKIVKQIMSLQKSVALQKGLVIDSKISENVPHFLIGDPARLQQILNNLMSNALKFTEQGSIILSVYGQESHAGTFTLNLAIKDTGIGIPKDKHAAIFEKFQQADTSTARKYGGTGLGLSITKDLAELMNGSITIDSEVGIGTTFIITIPTPIAEHQTHTEEKHHEQKVAINTKAKLMIVDDHPVNLLFMRQALSKMGFKNFDEAKSAKEALAYFTKSPYDLILMDCQMPEMDGFEAARRIRHLQQKEIPTIIAVTADAMKGAKEKCLAAGMDDYISKPVDKDKLRALLQHWIPSTETENKEEKNNIDTPPTHDVTVITPQAEDNIIDWEHLREFTDGDKDIENEILEMFITNLKADVTAIHKSFQNKDYVEWDSGVHKLYGACSHLGVNTLARICDKGQRLSVHEVDKIRYVHMLILNEYKRTHIALTKMRAA